MVDAFVDVVGDVVAIIFTVGLIVYGFLLKRFFRGGMMERPFSILLLAPFFFMLGELFDILDALHVLVDPSGILHVLLEVVFIIVLFYGFYSLREVWRFKQR